MYGATLVESSRDRPASSHYRQGCSGSSGSSSSSLQPHHHHHHHHYRQQQVVKTTKVQQSSRSLRVVTVHEKVIRSRLQLGYSTPTNFINRFPQKMDRLGPGSKGSGLYSSTGQPALSSSYMTGQYMYSQSNYAHTPYPGVQPQHHQQYVQHPTSYVPSSVVGASVAASVEPQAYGVGGGGVVQAYGGPHHHHQQLGPQSPYQQSCHKKSSVRNGDVTKRCRLQAAYELSQDLLDKQIEMLERKYGGVKARNAALTIQRAFRRYTLLKKFAAITAMAKAEKRLSRKMQEEQQQQQIHHHQQQLQQQHPQLQHEQQQRYQHSSQVYVQSQQPHHSPVNRAGPTRSMSLRERRHTGGIVHVDGSSHAMPRSQSGRCDTQIPAVHHQNQLTNHATVHHQLVNHVRHTPSPSGRQQQQAPPSPCWESSSQESANSSMYYYNPQDALCGLRQDTPPREAHRATPPCTSPSTVPLAQQALQQQNWSSSTSQLSSASSGRTSVGRASTGSCSGSSKKVPPEVPKRTSSINSRSILGDPRPHHNGLSKSVENGSLSSVQSSGSDSTNCESSEGDPQRASPVWKHKPMSSSPEHQELAHANDGNAILTSVKDMGSHTHASTYQLPMMEHGEVIVQTSYKVSETVRKRQYRVGLNLFNKKPERGINYLIRRGFLENSPQGVARFLISRKGLSKQMIGEYLGNLQNPFNMAVLECFSHELDLAGMQVDVALRKFQGYFRMPGEAQKIERLMEVFSQRYCQCNPEVVSRLRSPDTIFVLAFAIIMLNTDLHTPNLKPERRMRLDDFIKNLRGIDDCGDIDRDILVGIYERVKANEFKPGSDHVTQVMKVQATIVGKKPNMALPHRRLVCYCRLYEIPDINKKERPGVHQREVFLFNDLLVVTKILSKKKSSVTYTFRQSFPLCGMVVTLFEVSHYPYGIRLSQRVDNKVLVTFNARNEHDRCKFVEDLRESISEMDEMETLRIESELERQKSSRGARSSAENRDSGVADVEVCPCPGSCSERSDVIETDSQLKRSALSNSLLDIHEQFAGEKPQRRGSVGSLDSGMSISFQSTSASSMSQGAKAMVTVAQPGLAVAKGGIINMHHLQQQQQQTHPQQLQQQQPQQQQQQQQQPPSFLGGLFNKRERKLSHSEEPGTTIVVASGTNIAPNNPPYGRTTEV
ncbi:IQ motif and SEC7 domain-containing protein 1 isoform X2 [Trichogramma pretiosum]|uniref:IQ motif and SEC7 domain-containing protein 1 isoform X2 n=1 Tax=Trichogramma pretiosum TaxID=7493 RepID=UPI000C719018|nr:IQ motif and SEC7 domain-containing protein 1 isoform X2 [Trichogramma pretiosum]